MVIVSYVPKNSVACGKKKKRKKTGTIVILLVSPSLPDIPEKEKKGGGEATVPFVCYGHP
jgi:hypothetical protein